MSRCIYRIKNNTEHALQLVSNNAVIKITKFYTGEQVNAYATEKVKNEHGTTMKIKAMDIRILVLELEQPITYNTATEKHVHNGEGLTFEFIRDKNIPRIKEEGEMMILGTINEPFTFLGHRNDGYMMDISVTSRPDDGFTNYILEINDSLNPTGSNPFRETSLNRIPKLADEFNYNGWKEGDPIVDVYSIEISTPLFG